jgi:hypothetical protein
VIYSFSICEKENVVKGISPVPRQKILPAERISNCFNTARHFPVRQQLIILVEKSTTQPVCRGHVNHYGRKIY